MSERGNCHSLWNFETNNSKGKEAALMRDVRAPSSGHMQPLQGKKQKINLTFLQTVIAMLHTNL